MYSYSLWFCSLSLYAFLFCIFLLVSLPATLCTVEASLPKISLAPPREGTIIRSQWDVSSQPVHREWGKRQGSPTPNLFLSYNTQQAKQQHRVCPTQMYSSAVPNDISCLPSLPRPLHKELFSQIEIHQYLSARLLPKQTLKKVQPDA